VIQTLLPRLGDTLFEVDHPPFVEEPPMIAFCDFVWYLQHVRGDEAEPLYLFDRYVRGLARGNTWRAHVFSGTVHCTVCD